MKKQFYALAALFMMSFAAQAQVGIGTPTPSTSAMLDITSTTKGFLMPRMTTTDRTSIVTPAAGLQVYDTTTNTTWYFNGTVWVNLGATPTDINIYTNNGTLTSGRTVTMAANQLTFNSTSNGSLDFNNSGAGGIALRLNAITGKLGFNQNGNGLFAVDNSGTTGGRFMILENGNVGIGVAAPATKLDILGLSAQISNPGNASLLKLTNGTNDIRLQQNNGNGIVGTFSNNDFEIYSNSTSRMYFPATGFVGIGTSAPHATLDLGTNAAVRKLVLYAGQNNDNQFFGFGAANSELSYHVDGTGVDHVFYAAASATASNELMRIKGSGNVGIGTNGPATTLDVRTADPATARITVGSTGSSGGGISFGNSGHGLQRGFPTQGADNNVGLYTTSANLYLAANGAVTNQFVLTNTGNVGIGTATPSTTLHVNGIITATKIQGPSDQRFKKNIKPIENALDKVMKLGGYTYDWKDASEFPSQTLGKGHDMGVIAQEVEKQFPEAVTTNADGYKAVSYTELVPVLIEAIKTQQLQIDELKKEIIKLKK